MSTIRGVKDRSFKFSGPSFQKYFTLRPFADAQVADAQKGDINV